MTSQNFIDSLSESIPKDLAGIIVGYQMLRSEDFLDFMECLVSNSKIGFVAPTQFRELSETEGGHIMLNFQVETESVVTVSMDVSYTIHGNSYDWVLKLETDEDLNFRFAGERKTVRSVTREVTLAEYDEMCGSTRVRIDPTQKISISVTERDRAVSFDGEEIFHDMLSKIQEEDLEFMFGMLHNRIYFESF